MSVSFVPVKLNPIESKTDEESTIYFSSSLIKRLGIGKNQCLQISFGKKRKAFSFQTLKSTQGEIHLSKAIIKELLIPVHINNNYLVKYISATQTLYLGPVVALLTDFQINQKEEPHFRSIHHFCEELQQRVKEIGGVFYVFRIHDFNNESVHGYYFENGNWTYAKLPFPNVIYNRVHSRKLEQIPLFNSFRSILEELQIPLFNDRFLSKWEVYQQLLLEKQFLPYLPETRIYSYEALDDFINKYNTVYIKPVNGSQGKNIIKLIKEEDYFLCQTSQHAEINKYKQNEIFYHLKPLLNNKIYIIQQGILFAQYQESTMDFRILVHKNQHHVWEVTSIVARISAESQFVSNLAKGGKVMKPKQALQACFSKKQTAALISAIRELSIQTADILSSQSKGIIGELGIDIGVDVSGNPWIIEVNSKPSKSFDDSLAKIRPSAKAIIQFCMILSFNEMIKLEEKA